VTVVGQKDGVVVDGCAGGVLAGTRETVHWHGGGGEGARGMAYECERGVWPKVGVAGAIELETV
jgi:hypothetical protein